MVGEKQFQLYAPSPLTKKKIKLVYTIIGQNLLCDNLNTKFMTEITSEY